MGFKHLYLTVALLFVFNRSLHEVQAALITQHAHPLADFSASAHQGDKDVSAAKLSMPYRVHDGRPEDFAKIRAGVINLHAIDVPQTTLGVSDRVRLGQVSFVDFFFGREKKQEKTRAPTRPWKPTVIQAEWGVVILIHCKCGDLCGGIGS